MNVCDTGGVEGLTVKERLALARQGVNVTGFDPSRPPPFVKPDKRPDLEVICAKRILAAAHPPLAERRPEVQRIAGYLTTWRRDHRANFAYPFHKDASISTVFLRGTDITVEAVYAPMIDRPPRDREAALLSAITDAVAEWFEAAGIQPAATQQPECATQQPRGLPILSGEYAL